MTQIAQKTTKILIFLLAIGYLVVFYSNFFGIDLSDEGLAVLGFVPEQKLGIDFTHYQLLIRKFFPYGLDFVLARQIRLGLIIFSGITLLISIYKSKWNKYFEHTLLLIGATTLISLGTGIQVLSYNGLNQLFITLYIATLIQYIDKTKDKNKTLPLFWLILSSILLSITYLIRLPSFLLYIPIHFVTIYVISEYKIKTFFNSAVITAITLIFSILFLSKSVIPFSTVLSDVATFAKMSSQQTDGHGIGLVARYVLEFLQKCVLLFFTAFSYFELQKYCQKIKNKWINFVTRIALLFLVILMIISYPISVGSAFVFFFWLLIISFYTFKKQTNNFIKEKQKIIVATIFPIFAIASTLGSNVWIINLLLFYLSLWAVGFTFFISKGNEKLFQNIVSILVIIAVVKVVFIGFISPHRRGSLLAPHIKYEMKTRGSILLDSELYEYVTEIRSYLESQGLYGKPIIAVSRLPGLVYLLDSTMPGSINFTDAYWKVLCENINPNEQIKPTIIFRGNIPNELIECLAHKKIDLKNEYTLGKVIERGFSIYQIPTYIYVYKP